MPTAGAVAAALHELDGVWRDRASDAARHRHVRFVTTADDRTIASVVVDLPS